MVVPNTATKGMSDESLRAHDAREAALDLVLAAEEEDEEVAPSSSKAAIQMISDASIKAQAAGRDNKNVGVSDESIRAQEAREKAVLLVSDESLKAQARAARDNKNVGMSDESLRAQAAREMAIELALEDTTADEDTAAGAGATRCGTAKKEANEALAKSELGVGVGVEASKNENLVNAGENNKDELGFGVPKQPRIRQSPTSRTNRPQVPRNSAQPGALAVEGPNSSGSLLDIDGDDDDDDSFIFEEMAEARPVPDEELGNLQQAKPVSDDRISSNPGAMTALQKQEQDSTRCLLISAVIMAVGIIVALSIVFTRRQDVSTIPTPPMVPTIAPTGEPTAVTYVLELPEYTLDALQDPSSPQSRAYDWLLADPALESYPEWKKTQRFALATFYYSLGGGAWLLEKDWLDVEKDECEWYHRELIGSPQNVGSSEQLDELSDLVELADSACDDDGRYRFLVFPNNNLIGTLPPEIAMLSTGLLFLELSANMDKDQTPAGSLHGSIPTEIGLLTNLRRLYSERNLHEGAIPTELGLLQNLEELDIGYNPFSGGVPTELGNLGASLKLLSIKRSGVTGFLPTELFRLTNLDTFFMHGNTNITGGILSPDIQNMKKLQRFVAHDIPFRCPIPCV